jgi:hypothetical protein
VGFVAVDFRTRSFDYLPDPLGWVLIAVAAGTLRIRWAAGASVVAAALSVADVVLPYRTVSVDPVTGEEYVVDPSRPAPSVPRHQRWEDLSDGRTLVLVMAVIVGGAALGLLLAGLSRRAAAAGDTRAIHRLELLPVLVLAAWVVPYVVVALEALGAGDRFDPVWSGDLAPLATLGTAALAVVVVVLVRERERSWAVPPGHELQGPWDLRRRD